MSATPSVSEHSFQVEQAGAISVVKFTCSALGAEAAESIAQGLYRLAGASRQPQIVVDLCGVKLMSSAMLVKLMALSKWVWGEAGGRLVLCNIDPTILEVPR
jgi:anti-anti-sigma regulatory factor